MTITHLHASLVSNASSVIVGVQVYAHYAYNWVLSIHSTPFPSDRSHCSHSLHNTITTSTLQPYMATPWQRLVTEKWEVILFTVKHPQIGDKLAEICKTCYQRPCTVIPRTNTYPPVSPVSPTFSHPSLPIPPSLPPSPFLLSSTLLTHYTVMQRRSYIN